MENRNGLVVNARLTQATGRAERETALAVATLPGFGCVTLGADNVYDAQAFVRELRDHSLTPHIAQKPVTAIDQRTSRHLGYALNQGRRKPSRGSFRVAQTVALLRKTRYRGVARVGWMFTFAAAALNLVRMRTL
jgi:IS5 family transposase